MNERALGAAFRQAVTGAVGAGIGFGIVSAMTGNFDYYLQATFIWAVSRGLTAYDYEVKLDKVKTENRAAQIADLNGPQN